MLEVDCAHNHPIMKAFVQLLWSLHAQKKLEEAKLVNMSVVTHDPSTEKPLSNGISDEKPGLFMLSFFSIPIDYKVTFCITL